MYWELKRDGAAEQAYRQASQLAPEMAQPLNSLGMIYTVHGELEEAERCLREAIRLDPNFANAYFYLAQCTTFNEYSPEVVQMERLLNDEQRSADERILLAYALGKAHEDLDHRNRTFSHWELANRLHSERIGYDLEKDLKLMRSIHGLFDRPQWPDPQEHHPQPVFIIGMPRSGTSLTEQILASHPEVTAGGELELLGNLLRGAVPDYPEGLTRLEPADWRALGEEYLEGISPLAGESTCVTDKLPMNFMHVGMIRMMLPGARIIHCRRDPMDTCFSCFKKPLMEDGVAYTSDLEALGTYYAYYEWLMRYWNKLLPTWIHESHYEQLTGDLEGSTRRLLDFCGLEFEEACLAFHQRRSRVDTASAAQVRQPIHRGSVGSAGPYLDKLAPLKTARARTLEELGN